MEEDLRVSRGKYPEKIVAGRMSRGKTVRTPPCLTVCIMDVFTSNKGGSNLVKNGIFGQRHVFWVAFYSWHFV